MPSRNETGTGAADFVQGLGGAAAAGVLGLPGRYAFSDERADSQPVLVAVELPAERRTQQRRPVR